MGFQVSPGVVVTEKDLTTIVPSVSTTDGAFVGAFTWGPLNEVVLVGNEDLLVRRFGKPDNNTATSFFTAANFLAYGDKLRLVRVAEETVAKNATSDGSGLLVKNDDHYEASYDSGQGNSGHWVARFPGVLGNTLKVSVCASAKEFTKTMSGTYAGTAGSTTLTGTNASPEEEVVVGSIIKHASTNQERIVTAIDSQNDTITVSVALETDITAGTLTAKWEYADTFGIAPGTSDPVADAGGSGDEMHIVVVDEDGLISGIKGTVIEKYDFVSKASDAKSSDGTSIYYADVINKTSQYVRWLDHISGSTWGNNVASATDYTPLVGDTDHTPTTESLGGGVDGNDTSTTEFLSARLLGYDLFRDAEKVDVSLVLLGEANTATINYVVSNICESRLDCVAFFSPERADVVNNAGNEVVDTIAFKNGLNLSTSYAVMDNNWKYQYDKYNDTFRWLPLNGDIAGICVRTDVNQDPWWSPAGYNRGLVKNVIKLAYSPYKAERDDLYLNSINPVISTPGQGTLLFGDKTLQAKPSAFDRINVRRLFIVLEKAISRAAKYMLFEFNDEFTRQQFRNLVEPFLRDVQGRRGIYDFKVVCDRTNNTPEVIDRNEFVGDIYIKPARAINFIQLNFIAVRTGVDFSEIVGRA